MWMSGLVLYASCCVSGFFGGRRLISCNNGNTLLNFSSNWLEKKFFLKYSGSWVIFFVAMMLLKSSVLHKIFDLHVGESSSRVARSYSWLW
jgi:hypothetical protein